MVKTPHTLTLRHAALDRSRRWNAIVNGLLRRTVHAPLVRALGPRWGAMGSLAAFVLSGLFHEHMLLWTRARLSGMQLAFFVSQVWIDGNGNGNVESGMWNVEWSGSAFFVSQAAS